MFPELEKLYNDCQPNQPSRPQLLAALHGILKSIIGQGGSLENVSEGVHHATEPFKTITLILDGLEEVVAGDPLNDFLEVLESLASIQEQYFRIVNISRKNAEIESYMGKSNGWTWSERDATEVEHEIYEFAQFRISKHKKLKLQDIAIKELICRELSKGAKGMYRLAALQMTELELKTRNLKRVYEDDIVKIFKKLPRDLDTFYDVILKNVEEDLRTELEQVLKWLLYVGRPLFVEEVVEACAITIGQKREPPSVNTYRRQASDILDNLPGLVKLDPPYLDEDGSDPPPGLHVLTFAHFSVQEYLFPMRDVQRPAGLCRFTNAFQDHQDIARSCLAYVHHCCMQTHDGTSTYPLKSYCWNFWAMHMKGIADEREAQARLTPESLHLHNSVTSSVLYDENSDIVAADWATFNQCASCFSVAAYSQIVEALQNFEFPSDGKTPKGDSPSIESPLSVASALKMEHQLQMTNSSFRALRLLILQPSSDKDASVKCNMCMDFLENHPQYSSLSYVWGNQDNPRVIYVNGQAHWILASVCSALLQLRLADRPRVLWIDSICIDQFNLEEKVSQVSFMEHIFENAQNVIAWLAENPPANSGLAMDSLNRIIRLVDEADWITLSAVGRLLQEKYWSRIWIIQELAFAQTVIVCYGTYTSSMDNWGSIDEALERLLTETGTGTIVGASIKDFRSWSAVAAVQNIRRVRNSTGGRYTLPELLYVTRSHMTYDLRDKLFGLSALLRESERNSPLLAVDYNRSLGQVCLALTVYLVQEYQCLYALSNADIESQVSWVIDLRNIKTPLVGGDPGLEIYNAGGQRSKESLPIQVETDYRTLRAYGVAVGFVSEIFGTSGLSEDVMDAELETELWRKFAKDRCKLELNDAGSALDFDRNSLLSLANWSGVFEFATSTSSSHYRPYIGMAPKRIQEGDLIVVLFGGKDAFVLREWHLAVPGPKDGNKLYKLIGECYVDGIMHGEIVREFDKGEYQAQKFCII